jgi:hypothetical protein
MSELHTFSFRARIDRGFVEIAPAWDADYRHALPINLRWHAKDKIVEEKLRELAYILNKAKEMIDIE